MFARNVALRLKPNMLSTFTKTLDEQLLPLLKKQNGCQDLLVLENENVYVTSISLWDSKEHADAFDKSAYQQVLKSLEPVLDGAPKVRTTTVVHSAARQPVAATS
jgi:quinol monooxygenase YgiN